MRSLAVPVLALLLTACPRHRAAAPPPAGSEVGEKIAAQLTPYVESYGRDWGERRRFSGYVLVSQKDQVLYGKAFGHADREQQRAATADTSFRVGSVTKQFTAAAILLLQEDGKLSVTDTIGKHLPEYPAVGAGITIHQLLTHTAGVPDYTEIEAVLAAQAQPITVAALLATFWELPLDFAPGTEFRYSNSGYAVLGAILERVSGQGYAELLAQRLFAPAGMTRTAVGDAEGLDDRALGYQPVGNGLGPAEPIDLSVAFAAGAVRSTPNDLVRWHHALPKLLSEASLRALYTADRDDYAYGWVIGEVESHQTIGHNGGINGFTCNYIRVPDLDLVIVAWSNNTGVAADPIAEAALQAAFGGTLEPVAEPAVIALDPALAARLPGTYALTPASLEAATAAGVPAEILDTIATIALAVTDGELTMTPAGQPTFSLVPTGPTTFLQVDIGKSIEVTLPADGPATAFVITQGPLVLEFARAP